jgi:hypothetical protein
MTPIGPSQDENRVLAGPSSASLHTCNQLHGISKFIRTQRDTCLAMALQLKVAVLICSMLALGKSHTPDHRLHGSVRESN